MDDGTIFAPMTAVGRSAITALRLSGSETRATLERLCGACPKPRHLRDAQGEVLDQAVILWLPGPASYTGEDVAELHLHGGRAVLEGVAEALLAVGLRLAEPGEFSRRAFLNGRMDLVQAEAVGDLVAAETAGQRRQALRQMEGALGRIYEVWADRLTGVLAHQEALIDFPDEDLPPALEASLTAAVQAISAAVEAHLADGARGEKMREGLVFVIQGPPNVGKSTLVNALAGRDVAIVSPHAGTTRDTLEVLLVLGDVPVTLIDTAGLRETTDPVEAEGVRRARAKAAQADLVLRLVSAETLGENTLSEDTLSEDTLGENTLGENTLSEDTLSENTGADETFGDRDSYGCRDSAPMQLVVVTKSDLAPVPPGVDLAVCAISGSGMTVLRNRLAELAIQATANSGPPPLTRQRHRTLLIETRNQLRAAGLESEPELRAEALRLALGALGGITGKVGIEALLDRVFGEFCIGK
jgi:tRNA modification GTPase